MSKQKIMLSFGGVEHTFDCVANQNPLVRVFIDTSPGAMVLANRITEQYRASDNANTGTRFTTRMTLPVPAVLSGASSTGYAVPDKAIGENRSIIQVDISKFADVNQVNALVDATKAYVNSNEFEAMLKSQLMC